MPGERGRSILKTWHKALLRAGLVALFCLSCEGLYNKFSFHRMTALAPEPEQCALCQIPCGDSFWIVDPSNGKAEMLRLPRETGTLSHTSCVGIHMWVDCGKGKWTLILPISENPMDPQYFCSSCRRILVDHARKGLLLLCPEDMSFLPVRCGAAGAVADHSASVRYNGSICKIQIMDSA